MKTTTNRGDEMTATQQTETLFECELCGKTFTDGIDAGHHESAHSRIRTAAARFDYELDRREDKTAELIQSLKDENIIRHAYERTDWGYWLTDESQRFLIFRNGTVTLMQWTPGINDEIDTLPMDQATVETVACLI